MQKTGPQLSATSSWLSTQTTWPSLPWPASLHCSSATWRHIEQTQALDTGLKDCQWCLNEQHSTLHSDQDITITSSQYSSFRSPLPHRQSGLSITNIPLYQQHILPIMEYVCPNWHSASHAHDRMLQVVQSSVFTLWLTYNDRFTKIWRLQNFSDHVRVLTEGFKSKLGNAGSPLVWQLEGHICWPRAEQGCQRSWLQAIGNQQLIMLLKRLWSQHNRVD